MNRALAALLAVAAAFGVLASLLLPAAPAGAVSIGAPAPAVSVLTEEPAPGTYAVTATFGTLAERNAYIACVAPATEVSYSLRIKLLTYAGKALEGIRAGVPAATVTAGLRKLYALTSAEASRVYWCTLRVWG